MVNTFFHSIQGIQWKNELQNYFKSQFRFEKLIHNYDHNVIQDFLRSLPESFSFLNSGTLIFVILSLLIYVLLNMFLIWLSEKDEKAGLQDLLTICKYYYFKALGNAFLYLLIFIIWIGLISWVTLFVLEKYLYVLPSEKPIIIGVIMLIVILLLGIMYIINSSILSRKLILFKNKSVFSSFVLGLRSSFKQSLSFVLSWSIFIALNVLLFYIYLMIGDQYSSESGQSSNFSIYSFILIQQLIVFLLFLVKNGLYRTIRLKEEKQPKESA
ncbi:MAG: hypothetical protein HOP11_14795 [Saprospiraceae bacterium]|nr:hypothetical protein [Saprospiraceae bacterium]